MSPNKIFVLFFMCVMVMGAAAFIRLYRKERKLSWKLIRGEVFRLPVFRIWLLLLSLCFVFLFSILYARYDRLRASAVVTLNYSEAYKGQNANGTRYNMNEIICEDVLERAIEKGALEGVSVKELQSCLTVSPLVEGSAEAEETYHISTEFEIIYKGGRPLDLSAKNLVQLIGYAYKEYYIDKYADNFDSLDIVITPSEDFADLDYLDIVDYLTNQVMVIQNYMYGMAEKNTSFISCGGETFYSLAMKCENLDEVQIQNNLKAYILDNGISKNPEEYIGRLEYENTRLDYEYRRAIAAFNVRQSAIDLYSEEMTRIVLVPTWDTDGEYYMGRTKVGIDQLSLEAEEYSQTAADYSQEMQTNSSVIEAYANSGSSGQNVYLDGLIETISSEIMSLAEEAKRISQEYSETRMNQCITVTADGGSFLKYAVLAVGLYVSFYLTVDLWLHQANSREKKG